MFFKRPHYKRLFCCSLVVAAATITVPLANGETFVAPMSGNLYTKCVGGSAGAASIFGVGTSPTTFVPSLRNLPSACPTAEVLIGTVATGQTVQLAVYTYWNGKDYWAFSTAADAGSVVAFTDLSNSLKMNGHIIQQTSPTTWTMHLNDAAHYTVSTAEANNLIIQLRIDDATQGGGTMNGATTATTGATAAGGCDNSSFSGAYGFADTGYAFDTSGGVHLTAGTGKIVADGNGNLSGTDTNSLDGNISHRTFIGTYSLNADCTGSVTLQIAVSGGSGGTAHADIVAVNNARQINYLQTDVGWVVSGTWTKQSQ